MEIVLVMESVVQDKDLVVEVCKWLGHFEIGLVVALVRNSVILVLIR